MIISRRSENAGDELFLHYLVTETVAWQLGAEAWPKPVREQLLELQYQSRRVNFNTLFPDNLSQVILVNGEDAGWLVTADLKDQIRIAEIMLLAKYRGQGVGSAVIREVIADASRTGKPVRLGVDAMNPGALRLYQRLGFRQIAGDAVQFQMEYPRGADKDLGSGALSTR